MFIQPFCKSHDEDGRPRDWVLVNLDNLLAVGCKDGKLDLDFRDGGDFQLPDCPDNRHALDLAAGQDSQAYWGQPPNPAFELKLRRQREDELKHQILVQKQAEERARAEEDARKKAQEQEKKAQEEAKKEEARKAEEKKAAEAKKAEEKK